MSFVETFGGDTINPTYLSYAPYTISANLVTQWPLEADQSANVLASKIGVTATIGGLAVLLPDATAASVGQDVLIYNTGANTFSVETNDGTVSLTAIGSETHILRKIENTEMSAAGTVQITIGDGSAMPNNWTTMDALVIPVSSQDNV